MKNYNINNYTNRLGSDASYKFYILVSIKKKKKMRIVIFSNDDCFAFGRVDVPPIGKKTDRSAS